MINKQPDLNEYLAVHDGDALHRAILSAGDSRAFCLLSAWRKNAVSWLPFRKEDRILELHAGHGELTEWLCEAVPFGKVEAAADTEEEKETIKRRLARGKKTNGSVFDCADTLLCGCTDPETEQYSWVIIHGTDAPETELLERELILAEKKLREDGSIVFLLHNAAGIDSLLGNDTRKGGVSREAVLQIMDRHRDFLCRWYYPYPDILFPEVIFSENRMPKQGELHKIMYDLFPEKAHGVDSAAVIEKILARDLFGMLASDFICVCTKHVASVRSFPDYVKFSNQNRGRRFAVRTEICYRKKEKRVEKTADFPEAIPFVDQITSRYEKLQKSYHASGFVFNRVKQAGTGRIQVEYLEGKSLASCIEKALQEGNEQTASDCIGEFYARLSRSAKKGAFRPTENFSAVFDPHGKLLDGNRQAEGILCGADEVPGDIDLIFENVLLQENPAECWTILDYEWTFAFGLPIRFLLYRSLLYFAVYRPTYRGFVRKMWTLFGYDDAELSLYRGLEEGFQHFVTANEITFWQMQAGLGCVRSELSQCELISRPTIMPCLYRDEGKGYQEESRENPVPEESNGWQVLSVQVKDNDRQIRIDPAAQPGILLVRDCTDENGCSVSFSTNGTEVERNQYFFTHADPWILLDFAPGSSKIRFSYRYYALISTRKNPGEACIGTVQEDIQEDLSGIKEQLHAAWAAEEQLIPEIYLDFGQGLLEENRQSLRPVQRGAWQEVQVDLPEGVKNLRFDPAKTPGILELKFSGSETGEIDFSAVNGRQFAEHVFFFTHDDPWLLFSAPEVPGNMIFRYRYTAMVEMRTDGSGIAAVDNQADVLRNLEEAFQSEKTRPRFRFRRK